MRRVAGEGVTLFDTPEATPHVLWHRESRRHKWRIVGRAETGPRALALMDTSGHHGGHWMLIDNGSDPNEERAASATPGASEAA